MREKTAFVPRQRGSITGDRLLMLFKLVNNLAGYEGSFAKVTAHRLGYWRTLLQADQPPFPPIGDEIPGPLINPVVRRLRALLTRFLKGERIDDGTSFGQRIIYVCITKLRIFYTRNY